MAGIDSKLQEWAAEKISALLQMPPEGCSEIVENILCYDDAEELKVFLAEFTEKNADRKVRGFVEELFQRRTGGRGGGPPPSAAVPAAAAAQAAQQQQRGAPAVGVHEAPGRGRGVGGGGAGRGAADAGRAGRGAARVAAAPQDDMGSSKFDMPMFVKQEGDKRLMVIDAASGRYEVLTNCLNCGKVVVEQEGWGPCLFCGNPLEVGDRLGPRRGDDRGFIEPVGRISPEEQKYNDSFERAKATKDRLLSYDRDAKKRTKVFDDATDWYSESINPWLSEKQREEAMRRGSEEERKKKEEKRRIHATIDLFGRTVISADAEVEERRKAKEKESLQAWTEEVSDQNRLLSMMQEEQRGMNSRTSQLSAESKQLYDKLRASLHATGKEVQRSGFKPVEESQNRKGLRWDSSGDANRVEDEFSAVSVSDFAKAAPSTRLLPVEDSPYGDETDGGFCLSMHQPWASLLVHGFKRAEGRNWRTEHRGRLWIHAAGKEPEEDDINMLEQTYRSIYDAHHVPVPPLPSESSGYPTSVLLGCVDVEACWSKEEYTEVLRENPSMPQEENDSDFIFWCLRPRKLAVPLKMAGDHKIWRLPKASLSAAQRGLQPVRWPAPGEGEQAMASPPIPEDGRARSRAEAQPDDAAAEGASSAAPAGAPVGAPAAPKAKAAPGGAATKKQGR